MAEFNPSDAGVEDVLKKLDKADEEERQRILTAERNGKKRKTILEAYGVDPDERVDSTGRTLYPWEVAPEEQTFAVEVEEDDEARKAREAQAEQDQKVAAATDQGGSNPAGTGVAPAGGTTAAGTTGGATGATTTAAGAPTTGGTTGGTAGTA